MLKIVISPAKKMKYDDAMDWGKLPLFIDRANEIRACLSEFSYESLKELWKGNDQIAMLNHERLQKMTLEANLTPAILAYEGIQYQYMAPHVFDKNQWKYVENHLAILSGFYGLLKATDGIIPYRLEMQAKLQMNENSNLYDYWNEAIYNALKQDCSVIVNLASKEYSKVIEKYLGGTVKMVTCVFGELSEVNGKMKVKTKATDAKMARGEMVRYMAEHNVQEVEQLKCFDRLSYTYSSARSSDGYYIFLKE
jgi:cytoplasmic iron level regulating protein YaaA (DUF328/UPF0246 family)